jgi:hypothetical protein
MRFKTLTLSLGYMRKKEKKPKSKIYVLIKDTAKA